VTDPDLTDLSKSQQDLTMTAIGPTSTDLHWDVLAIKRPGLTREWDGCCQPPPARIPA